MMCGWTRLLAPKYRQENFSIFACCSAAARKQVACTFCNSFRFSRDERCSLWRTSLSHAGELSLLHLHQDFAIVGDKRWQWPSSRSHGPKAHVLILDMLSSSAHAKQMPLKWRWLQVSTEPVLAAPGANGVMSNAGDRREAQPSSERARAEVKVRPATAKSAEILDHYPPHCWKMLFTHLLIFIAAVY